MPPSHTSYFAQTVLVCATLLVDLHNEGKNVLHFMTGNVTYNQILGTTLA